MKPFTSFHELDALGEGLSKDYINRTHRWNARCFDIEGFITDYLGLTIRFLFMAMPPVSVNYYCIHATTVPLHCKQFPPFRRDKKTGTSAAPPAKPPGSPHGDFTSSGRTPPGSILPRVRQKKL